MNNKIPFLESLSVMRIFKQAAAAAAVMSRSYTGGQSSYTQQQQYPATSPGRR